LAVLAKAHGIPFYVALPRSTFDPAASEGTEIPIEERAPAEVMGREGEEAVATGAAVWNPAFDITPAHLVTAFVTDGGVLRPPFDVAIDALLQSSPRFHERELPIHEDGSPEEESP
jgi:methylthioribose-1-phosphate isomerase